MRRSVGFLRTTRLGELLRRLRANICHFQQAWRDAPVPPALWEDERALWEQDVEAQL